MSASWEAWNLKQINNSFVFKYYNQMKLANKTFESTDLKTQISGLSHTVS